VNCDITFIILYKYFETMATGGIPTGEEGSKHAQKMSKMDDFDFPYCRDVMVYEKVAKIGQGTFG